MYCIYRKGFFALCPQELWEEGKEEYLHSGWNVMDCSMATCYLLYYILKVR